MGTEAIHADGGDVQKYEDLTMRCPRCRSKTVDLMARSKPEGLWSVHLCTTCLYTWRSSEPASATDPETYDPRFRISPDDIAGFKEFPVVPPRRVGRF